MSGFVSTAEYRARIVELEEEIIVLRKALKSALRSKRAAPAMRRKVPVVKQVPKIIAFPSDE